jgi:NADH dehydrogenase
VLPNITVIEADIHNPQDLQRYLAQHDVVINLVGILNEHGDNGQGFHQAHVVLTEKIVTACRQHGIKRLLHMSALHAATDGPSHYLRSKGQAEKFVLEQKDLRVTCFRPSVIFGPGDSFFNRFAQLLRLSPGIFPLACANARFAPVYVGDVVSAFVQSLHLPSTYGQSYDLCGPKRYRLVDLVSYTAQLIGKRCWIVPLGKLGSSLQANVLEYMPGKPFSRDNYRSMKIDSVCNQSWPSVFQAEHASIESRVPDYLTHRRSRDRYMDIRQHSHR